MDKTICAFTDGACSGNPGKGGCSFVVVDSPNAEVELFSNYCGESNTTNNRMELLGIILALEYLVIAYPNYNITIYTDSAYCHNCYAQKWYKKWAENGWVNAKKEPVKNKDLWERLIPFFNNNKITFEKVKGHSTNKWNNRADELAVKGRLSV